MARNRKRNKTQMQSPYDEALDRVSGMLAQGGYTGGVPGWLRSAGRGVTGTPITTNPWSPAGGQYTNQGVQTDYFTQRAVTKKRNSK